MLAYKAAINSKAGKRLYFVAKGNGAHQFSATLKQHNAAIRKYQLKKQPIMFITLEGIKGSGKTTCMPLVQKLIAAVN